MTEVKKT